MFLDASAIVAALAPEPDSSDIIERISNSELRFTSAIAIWEAGVAIARINRLQLPTARAVVIEFLAAWDVGLVEIDDAIGSLAFAAFDQFGKGRHPAALNMGDCFAYACAKSRAVPLMCKGDDFPLTDIALA